MQILKFQFEDKSEGWRLNETSFNDRMTLLVGASGVGKTLILKALDRMKYVAEGWSYKGAEWNIEYVPDDGNHHVWRGAFQNHGLSDINWRQRDTNRSNYSKIEYEQLEINGEIVAERDTNGITFNKKPTLKLSPQESILKLFQEEEQIKPSCEGFEKIDFTDHTNSVHPDIPLFSMNLPQQMDLDAIRKNRIPLIGKLHLVKQIEKNIFETIQDRFISIFPQVRAIKSDILEPFDNDMPPFYKDCLFIQIQEQGVDHWIWPNRISSGMYRTLLQLCDLYLCPDGTVFLMDEFENSLGINCIKEITEDIFTQDRQLQFIVTSHHPYIIGNIPFDNWKIVTRNGGVVKTHSLADLGCDFTVSRHDSFMQLMQLDEFLTGQEQEDQEQENEHLLLGRR